jgi:hypothetical protein
MKTRSAVLILSTLCALLTRTATAATIFADGFETGSLGPQWSVTGTNNYRVIVAAEHAPAEGKRHLLMDDSTNDATYSAAEATLTLDLQNKRNVVLSFQAKSLGNEPNNPPTGNFSGTRNYDGVAISVDGGVTWRSVQSLANVGTAWQTYSVTLDSAAAALGGPFGSAVQIRFSE